ncbi:hypothetical protein H5410_006466 [Solanum commersonii]|uniref:Uncharacterized protein n=1 Tax=Solanum commersonii TaxID=4109 RepID=A0A9J6A9X3_SOLCO|nr:hypothetical protein H5410_006466 [Solanum commersonii]
MGIFIVLRGREGWGEPILTEPDQPDKNPGSVSVPIRSVPYRFNRYRTYRYGNRTDGQKPVQLPALIAT